MSHLLEAQDLVKEYPTERNAAGRVTAKRRAVNGASFTLDAGRTLALVGESGAGKSTTARLVMRLVEADSGRVRFDGQDLLGLPRRDMRRIRQSMQLIFQDPYSSLDPRMSVVDAVAEPLLVHRRTRRVARRKEAAELLARVGLQGSLNDCMPHHLSGGQLQRVSIARALSVQPKLLVCDEPVAALDVSIRAQVINLMIELQEELGLAYLFISHDLALVRLIADDVAVMRDGEIVELGQTEQVFEHPSHQYTQELLSAIPSFDFDRD